MNISQAIHSQFTKGWAAITPTLRESKFLQEGVLTPEEFVAAGDLLVYKCPTWSWAAGIPEKAVPYLPADKQFLITRNVPCKTRFKDDGTEGKSEVVDDEWLSVAAAATAEDIPDIDAEPEKKVAQTEELNDEDIPDMEDFTSENNLVEEDPASAQPAVSNIQKTRTYDITITYDKYYQTPKVWLCGYSENQQFLSADEIFMDISAEHARKTVTLEVHPHIGTPYAFIHPCRHASVMKKFVARMVERGVTPQVDKYLLLFLKFMGAVIPTIAYDHTFDFGGL
jgi:ubiquitin-like-conjugating enzyme ATG3